MHATSEVVALPLHLARACLGLETSTTALKCRVGICYLAETVTAALRGPIYYVPIAGMPLAKLFGCGCRGSEIPHSDVMCKNAEGHASACASSDLHMQCILQVLGKIPSKLQHCFRLLKEFPRIIVRCRMRRS